MIDQLQKLSSHLCTLFQPWSPLYYHPSRLLNQGASYCIQVKISVGGITLSTTLIHFIAVRDSRFSGHLEYILRTTSTEITQISSLAIPMRYPISSKFYWSSGSMPNSSTSTTLYVSKYSIIISESCAYLRAAAIGFLLTLNQLSCLSS